MLAMLLIVFVIAVLFFFYCRYRTEQMNYEQCRQAAVEKMQEEIHKIFKIRRLLDKYRGNPADYKKYVLETLFKEGGVFYCCDKKYVAEVALHPIDELIDGQQIELLHQTMRDVKADEAFFITTSSFRSEAVEYARTHSIRLIHGRQLVSMLDAGLKDNNSASGDIVVPG